MQVNCKVFIPTLALSVEVRVRSEHIYRASSLASVGPADNRREKTVARQGCNTRGRHEGAPEALEGNA